MNHQPSIVETGALSGAAAKASATGEQGQLQRQVHLHWTDESATQAFAAALAGQPELVDAFVTLHGDLGAGKTTLARHLLQALGVQGRIKSPTYTLVEAYELPALAIWHFDFYRFNDPQEWEDAGFRDIFASPGLKLAEWPQKAEGLLPVADLDIAIHADGETARTATLGSHTARGAALLHSLACAVGVAPEQAL